MFLISLIDIKPSPSPAHLPTWIIALLLELAMVTASFALYTNKHREPSAKDPEGGLMRFGMTQWEAIEVAIDAIRVLFLVSLVFFYILFSILRQRKESSSRASENATSEETTGLLSAHQAENGTPNGPGYGGVNEQKEGWSRQDKVPSKSWWEYIRGYSLFFPYLWPAKSVRLQGTVVVCFVLVLSARVVNVLIPYQAGYITNILAGKVDNKSKSDIPWAEICLYIFYRLLQGNNGLLGALRAALWVPISQYSYQELSTASFEHVHGLSLDFHLGKKTGEVLSALSKGNSINTFLEQVTFQVVPMLVDLLVAIGFFLINFDAYYALVVAIVTFVYLYLTIRLAQWRADIRREMVNFSRQEDAVK